MLIGFTLNVFLFGMMTTQVYIYYTSFRKDRRWMKLYVLLVYILDTLNSVCDCVYLYDSLILHFGDPQILETANWVFALEPALNGVIGGLVQGFFAWRVVALTKNWILGSIVIACALTGGAAAIVTTCEVIKVPYFTRFQEFQAVVTLWLVSAILGDVLITSIMVWFLVSKHHKTGFRQSDLVVDRIIRLTVQTGLITSVVAIVDLVVYLTDSTGTHLIFNFILCKLYTNTLMSSLNSRKGWKFSLNSTGPSERLDDVESEADDVSPRSQNELESRSSNWLSKRMSRSAGHNVSLAHGSKKYSKKQKTLPEVFVHVESHELRDVSHNASPNSYSNESDEKLRHETIAEIPEIGDPPMKRDKKTVVIHANGFSASRQGRKEGKDSSFYAESDSDEPKKSQYSN
ncbi:hypothetical protein P691DRAFT_754250 [Macrolepiota fuliginosa MF-IS2]|uniref:DUF6534 domain-containing protein n=1 Tax=Macrolepiota fuliginosa MF-IS2 TaxID=1400762 RepID=A0A9P5XNK6_9AGAR|nr:hypothetical protein P691DRAFT_754250 [Macrolepiota fuliginosa MF-IS2]